MTEPAQLAAAYEAWRASDLGRITDEIEERLLLDLTGPVQGKRVLDAGCGDGLLADRLALAGAKVTGLDADPRMLAAARERACQSQALVTHQVTYVAGDVRSLPFPDGSFDIVVAVTVLCFVAEAGRAVSEMARVLRPGGHLVIGELGRYSLWAVRRRVAGWLGSATWRAAHFRTARELKRIAISARLTVEDARGAVYYPPCNACARWFSPFDARLAEVTTIGAAFIVLRARKPADGLATRSRRPTPGGNIVLLR